MLEEINTMVQRSGRPRNENKIEVQEEAQSVYLSPHRAPAPSDMSATLLTTLGRESARSRLGSPSYNLNSSEVPNVLQYGSNRRNRKTADFAPFFELKKRLAQLEFDRGQLMAEIYDERGSIPEGSIPDLGRPLKEGIDAVLPGISYEGVQQTEERDYKIQFEDRSGEIIEFDDLSSGEKDGISLIFNLVEKKIESRMYELRDEAPEGEDLIVIIDSPESYLHPAMQERFLEFVKSQVRLNESTDRDSSLQVLLCTHSQTIIQNVSDGNLYFLLYRDQREGNQLVSAEGISLDTLESITGELGITALSSGNPIVLLEGGSDRDILRRLFPEIRDRFELLPIGGKGKIIKFSSAFNQVVPELYSEGIFLFAILDRDRDLNVESGYEDFVHQLSVTCIENHLLDDEALFEAVTTLVEESVLDEREIADPADIENELNEIVTSSRFREEEIKTRLNENLRINVYINDLPEFTPTNIKERIDSAVETKKDRTEQIIEDVTENVGIAITERNYSKLNGKVIMRFFADEFGLEKGVLARVAAEKLESEDRQPESLNEILEDISQKVEENPRAAALLDSV